MTEPIQKTTVSFTDQLVKNTKAMEFLASDQGWGSHFDKRYKALFFALTLDNALKAQMAARGIDETEATSFAFNMNEGADTLEKHIKVQTRLLFHALEFELGASASNFDLNKIDITAYDPAEVSSEQELYLQALNNVKTAVANAQAKQAMCTASHASHSQH